MSLRWNTEKCRPPQANGDEEAIFRTSLIYLTLGLDLGSVTEDNVDEWLWRIWHQKTAGLEYFDVPEGMTPQVLRAMIARWVGLYTNVPSKPRKEYLRRASQVLADRTSEELADAIEAAENQAQTQEKPA